MAAKISLIGIKTAVPFRISEMSHRLRRFLCLLPLLTLSPMAAAQETVESYLREYPNQEQVKMMNTWLEKNEKGTFKFTGLVDPSDTTVVMPQATVDYGYNWFSISDGPAILTTPTYDKFLSLSVFDMKHNVPAVITNPTKPILLKRPSHAMPEGDFEVVELETDQGLVLTRMVVVENLDAVVASRSQFQMQGGKGDMQREVQQFSPETEKNAQAVIDTVITYINPDAPSVGSAVTSASSTSQPG